MQVINIPASKSMTLSNKSSGRNIKDKKITVGNYRKCTFFSYLFFDASIISSCASLLSATLILFKIADFFNFPSQKFSVYPSLQQVSSFTTCPIELDPELKQDFSPFTCDVAIEVDITSIFAKWINNTLINRGIVIIGNNNYPSLSCFTSFGSAYSKDITLIPFIRVGFKPCIPMMPIPNLSFTSEVITSSHR
jgi:hypothetical protein